MLTKGGSELIPSTRRQNHIDAISGLFIVQVVLLHIIILTRCTENLIYDIVFQQLFVFYMPWFFFKNGLFYRHRNMKDAINYITQRLAKPYIYILVVSAAATILYSGSNNFNGIYVTFDIITQLKYLFWHGALAENLPLYFLLSLSIVRISAATIDRFSDKYGSTITFIATVVVLIVLAQVSFRLPDYIINSFIGLLFFSLGRLSVSLFNSDKIAYLATAIYTVLVLLMPSFVDFRTGFTVQGKFWIWVIISLCGIIFTNYFMKLINKVFTFKLLIYIGQHSMAIYVIHFLLIFLLTRISVDYLLIGEGTLTLFGLVSACSTIILALLHKTIYKII